ncbi:MAG: hypothetical protein ACTS27_04445 [Phycisphaerales bacterium]
MRWILAGALSGLAAFLVGLAVYLTVDRPTADPLDGYPRDTPEATIESVFLALENGEAGVIPRFVYAATPEQELVLSELGRLFGSLQDLAATIEERFPEEVAEIRASSEGGGGFVGAIREAGRNTQGTGAPTRNDPRFSATLGTLLADPLGWLRNARDRVGVVPIADDLAAITVDNNPAFGVGMTMRREEGIWFIEPPLNAPGVSRFAPKTVEEHQVLASMLRVVDNTVVELDKDLRAGKADSLDDAASLAGQKAFAPIALVFIAYQRAMEARDEATP